MDRPTVTARPMQVLSVEVDDVDFYLEEAPVTPDRHGPQTRAYLRKLLHYIMPYHIEQHYFVEDTTPETIDACIESLIDHLPIEAIMRLVWDTIENHFESNDMEMYEA